MAKPSITKQIAEFKAKAFKYDRLHKSLTARLSKYPWVCRTFMPRYKSLRDRHKRLEMSRFAYTAMMLGALRSTKK